MYFKLRNKRTRYTIFYCIELCKELFLGTKKKKKKHVSTEPLSVDVSCYRKMMHVCIFSNVQHFGMLWTATCQVPLSLVFSRQVYLSGCHFLPQEILPIQGLKSYLLCLLYWQANYFPLNHLEKPGKGY